LAALWDDLGMVASYEEFEAEHHADHLNAFNRWCAVVGNPMQVVGAVVMLLGRRKVGAALTGSGAAITVVGHVVEGICLGL
jgi:hypothetical protein